MKVCGYTDLQYERALRKVANRYERWGVVLDNFLRMTNRNYKDGRKRVPEISPKDGRFIRPNSRVLGTAVPRRFPFPSTTVNPR